MTTITAFLLARIAEDEAEAKSVLQDYEDSPPLVYDMAQVPMLDAGDPDRVLAECKSKLRIVEACEDDERWYDLSGHPVLRALASVYADHPEFREEWRG